MLSGPQAEFHQAYWQNSFDLETHLQEFLQLDKETLQTKLRESRQTLANLGKHFDWELVNEFYRDQVGTNYILELGAWHLESFDYIGDMVKLIADFAQGNVLDFGGGIGTHAIAAALCPNVKQVNYLDLNPLNCEFVAYRVKKLGLSSKIRVESVGETHNSFDTIMCFDVMEHLPNPSSQLREFHRLLNNEGKLLINWYFHQGFNQEFPFHLDDPVMVTDFFKTLQSHFLELFHPHLITTRCYQKN